MKNTINSRLLLLFLGMLIIAGCCQQTDYDGVIAVREFNWRMELPLPLSVTDIDSIVQFIRWGGSINDPGGSPSASFDSSYVRLFAVLTDPSVCYMDSLVRKYEFSQHVLSTKPRTDVYDARQKDGPDGGGRHAYLFANSYWLIFYIEPGPAGLRTSKYDNFIIQRHFKVTGEK